MSSSPEILSDFPPSPTLSQMTTMTDPSSSPPSEPAADIDFDGEHYWDFVTFDVQGRLFRVPKYRFVEESEYFSTLYDLKGRAGEEYGLGFASDDLHLGAVRIEDATVDEFKTFLRVLYPRDVESPPVLAQDEWMSLLGLATKWRFGDLRKMALGKIEFLSVPSRERVDLAERLTIPAWLVEAYKEIVTREACITLEEGEWLGMERTLRLCQLREKYFRGKPQSSGFGFASASTSVAKKVIEDIGVAFFAQLEGMREKEKELYPTKAERKAIEEAKVKEATEAERRDQSEVLAKMKEEAMRVAQQYDRALEEQRAKLVELEQERERALAGAGVENMGAAVPVEGVDTGEVPRAVKRGKKKGGKTK